MDQPKYVVCMTGVEGFVADYGDLDLAIARAKELCTPQAQTFVLSPIAHFRRQPAGKLVGESPVVEPSEGERMLVAERVLKNRQAGRTSGPTTEELHGDA
jgi:hypothetical protein